MPIQKLQRLKVILLVAGYLCIVIGHVQFLTPKRFFYKEKQPINGKLIPKGYDKSGYAIVVVPKICKTVLNRSFSDKHPIGATLLYTDSLFKQSVILISSLKLSESSNAIIFFFKAFSLYLRI
ncbi:hypothetical protein IM792_01665 [Mucilaginibacter sp. JRF]|uniref:hypothetical protein n=1 Tax=Mucilaginibacter sp. JRF TaxID=2780088 RepID=UPI001880D6A4|nr:hypothetical protein [Mucilaginibacter sp. JRF]MBE9583147.1 hypothetical protein [Mucilaginibacter sp. JRF]